MGELLRHEEAFGEKIRALGERTRPRDLYDVVNLYRHTDTRPTAAVLRNVLQQKCDYKAIPVPTMQTIATHHADLAAMWGDMLGHQLPQLPPLNDFWHALPGTQFRMAVGHCGSAASRHHPTRCGRNRPCRRCRRSGVPVRTRPTVEIIRFAAANYLGVDLTYDGSVRRIEPYSLRQTLEGNFVLHAIRNDTGEHRSYRVDRMQGASVTSQVFTPRYVVELSSTGPRRDLQSSPATHRPDPAHCAHAQRGANQPTHPCSVCRKTFNRSSMSGSLNAHKNPRGYPCPGRVGVYVRTRY